MVKFYHIIGFTAPVTQLDPDNPIMAHYMGKTSDLLFKTEPDKTIDLDDGCTEVGSEKLSVSFTCLEKLQNSWPLATLWMVPVCSDYYNENPDIVQIDLRGSDYHLESKSGDFEKILFNATLRYSANSPAYSIIYDYFQGYNMVLGKLQYPYNGDSVKIDNAGTNYGEMENDAMLIEHCFASVGLPYTDDNYSVVFGDDAHDLYGPQGLIWFNPDGN